MTGEDARGDELGSPSAYNPQPQPRPDRCQGGDMVPLELAGVSMTAAQDKVAIVMVGLPGSGKSLIANSIHKYFEFFHRVRVMNFNAAQRRRDEGDVSLPASSYDNDNEEGAKLLEKYWLATFADLKAFLSEEPDKDQCNGRVGIFDATNVTRNSRNKVHEELDRLRAKVIFIEVMNNDPSVIEANVAEIIKRMPDYRDVAEADAARDFHRRREHYAKIYEGIDMEEEGHLSWVKITNLQTFIINRVRNYLSARIVQFILNLRPHQRTIYISRHGQSEYNELGKVGGDSNLTEKGLEYARRLAKYAKDVICRAPKTGEVIAARLWTSTLTRTKQTSQFIDHPTVLHNDEEFVVMRPRAWTNLDEIYAGICDGMTYEEIAEKYPDEARRRGENKLSYRYPRGESYMDLIQRVEPIVHELERHEEPLLIIGHQAVLRVIYCYLKGIPRENAPVVAMPLHTIVKLEPRSYECTEERIPLMLDSEGKPQDTPSH